jgi:hypothetical protein
MATLALKIFLPLLLAASCSALDLPQESSSCANDEDASAGAQLMQKTQVRGKLASSKSLVACSTMIGKQAPLSNAGFAAVSESCCYADMKDFIRRTAAALSLQVCDEGGLSGIAPFFSCPSTPTTYAALQGQLRNSTAESGDKCHWLASVGDNCTAPNASCGVYVNSGPLSLFRGYIGLDAERNPPALVRTPEVWSAIKSALAGSLGISEDVIVVIVGTGPIGRDGDQGSSGNVSLLQLMSCTVFVTYEIVQTDPPSLVVDELAASIAGVVPTKLQTDISAAIAKVDIFAAIGPLKITTFRYCQEGGTCVDKSPRAAQTRTIPSA